ncbi:hypothetical protein V6N13_094428 [Hibiscus sabdariffa]|uniref:Uncharacterized protein n=2 Tax=Hibiscus sabdariffa TaxID=183260 RepID=A0ABR2PPV5_9ROSI
MKQKSDPGVQLHQQVLGKQIFSLGKSKGILTSPSTLQDLEKDEGGDMADTKAISEENDAMLTIDANSAVHVRAWSNWGHRAMIFRCGDMADTKAISEENDAMLTIDANSAVHVRAWSNWGHRAMIFRCIESRQGNDMSVFLWFDQGERDD